MDYECKLTTIDNPYDPFEEFDLWNLFDKEHNYNSCEYLMRIANVSDEMSQLEIDIELERAIDEIIALNPIGIYKKKIRNVAS